MTVLRGVLASAKGRTIVAASVDRVSGLAATFALRTLSERMIAADMQVASARMPLTSRPPSAIACAPMLKCWSACRA